MNEQSLRFAETIATTFQNALSLIYKSVFQITNDLLAPFLVPVLTLYFIFIGYQIILGNFNIKKIDVLARLFIVFPLIISVIFNFHTYNEWVANPILDIKDFITQKISSLSGEANMFTWLDTQFLKITTNVFSTYFQGSFILQPMNYVFGFLLIVTFFYIYVYSTIYSIQSLVYVGLLLIIGPVFLFFFCFNFSKNLFFLWFRTLMTYFMYSVFLALILFFVKGAIDISLNQSLGLRHADIFTIFVSVISIIFIKAVPELSNAITQGASSGHEAANFSWSRIATNLAKKTIPKGA
ncbi:type IV secretion system protein [Arcobacter sp. F2176]|uniref:type IV secretion system protein n=1 Tax=Arcobacter sp. F2176 TaxID=2044511 RepID=UPI00100BB1F0|nr:type IV secretion system protein [Arcobacter sp. F2176]RXJ82175.1 hypothetical protein CRU95_04620 [Arcobacter sp. F2176]